MPLGGLHILWWLEEQNSKKNQKSSAGFRTQTSALQGGLHTLCWLGEQNPPKKKSKDSPGIRTRVSALSGKRAYHSATETQKILVKIYYQMCASKAVDLNKKYVYDNMSLP